ncbi:MAG: CotH kinase family protein [Tenericutes bacterium]|nr:CotH kinase family protein [Mycoplasmatota bacterium]
MKKIFILFLLLSTAYLVSCDAVTTSVQTTSTNGITTNLETSSTTFISTTELQLSEQLDYLSSLIPRELTEDFTLPVLENQDILVSYYQDDLYLTDNIIEYNASLDGINSVLVIEVTYNDLTLTKSITIRLVENETQYNLDLITQVFLDVNERLELEIPSTVRSDFLMPVFEMDGLSVQYLVDISSIYNGYYIYPFPEKDQYMSLNVTVTYQGVTQLLNYNLTIKEISLLDRIPEIRINTLQAQEVVSKEEYVTGEFTLVTYNSNLEPITLHTDQTFNIRARGNSTFEMPKLSYRMKFSEKTNLLFDYSEDDWVILANFADQTLIRNYLANSLSESMNMAFTPSSAFVDVFINDEYLGNYMLTDQIEVTNDRVDIEEKSANLDTGYLIEFDKRMLDPQFTEGVEGWDYFNLYGVPYVVKSPKTDKSYYSQQQLYYIEDYFATTLTALRNGFDYSAYIDESTFIDWFIVNELFQNVDSGYSSVYFYKDTGGLLKMGPIWDFDLSTGNPGHLEDFLRQPEGWYTSLPYKNIWFNYLMEYDSFKLHLKERWNELYNIQIQALLQNVYPVAASITHSRYNNFLKWDIIGVWEDWYTAPEVLAADTYQKQLEFLDYYLNTRAQWLNEEINKF